jgi:hypothetical protein
VKPKRVVITMVGESGEVTLRVGALIEALEIS